MILALSNSDIVLSACYVLGFSIGVLYWARWF